MISTEEKAYCSKCDKDVSYSTQETTKKATIRETTFCYTHVIANCNVCGERVFPVSIGTLNDKTKYEELERQKEE